MSYDTECLRLARYFLEYEDESTPEAEDELAQLIQTTVENFIMMLNKEA